MRLHRLVFTAIIISAMLCLQGRTDPLDTAFAATNVCGTISDGNWTLAGSPYVVTCNSSLASALTIAPGVSVRFEAGTRLDISTTLHASGKAASPITFTSNAASPAAGDWSGLHFGSGSDSSILSYVVVEYGTGVEVISSSPNLITSRFRLMRDLGFTSRPAALGLPTAGSQTTGPMPEQVSPSTAKAASQLIRT